MSEAHITRRSASEFRSPPELLFSSLMRGSLLEEATKELRLRALRRETLTVCIVVVVSRYTVKATLKMRKAEKMEASESFRTSSSTQTKMNLRRSSTPLNTALLTPYRSGWNHTTYSAWRSCTFVCVCLCVCVYECVSDNVCVNYMVQELFYTTQRQQ